MNGLIGLNGLNGLPNLVSKVIEDRKERLWDVAKQLWDNPELAYEEHFAHKLLAQFLEDEGFQVKRSHLLPTSFAAEFIRGDEQQDLPVISILCEYDALPGIGHACGHNLIAEVGVAAGVAVKEAMTRHNINGKLLVLGTPAEEGGNGKDKLMALGAFDGVDFAMMAHPMSTNMTVAKLSTLALNELHVTFKGKAAHAAAGPHEGINALDAAVACYAATAMLRQHIKSTCRIGAILTKGGDRANIIPDHTEMVYVIRAIENKDLEDLTQRVVACFESGAKATGCEMSYVDHRSSKAVLSNTIMCRTFVEHAKRLGTVFGKEESVFNFPGSTDMGSVSHVIPSIHIFYGIGGTVAPHTVEFTSRTGLREAQLPTLQIAKALALTALSLYKDASLREQTKQEFQQAKKLT
jgi:amidohydrolase